MQKDETVVGKRINVTKTWLPDKNKFNRYIDQIYASGHLTNNGPLVQELTERLEKYLGVENLLLVTNGTLALQVAYRVLEVENEAVTTPFSFAATASSLVWEHIRPRFADIDENTFCLDPNKVVEAIGEDTTAIVPVHVFGNACEVEKIDKIAQQNGLKVVYDASHAFGIKYNGKSILSYGDASTLSFHATKLFHTIEGGAIVFKRREDLERAKLMINFGIDGPDSIKDLGINAKMTEFQAAMGLCVLDDVNEIIEKRRKVWEQYQKKLAGQLKMQEWRADNNNYSYFPVVFNSEKMLIELKKRLNEMNIHPRRYFYPSLNTVSSLSGKKQHVEVSEGIAARILCLPIFPEMEQGVQKELIAQVEGSYGGL